jgi:hypothetical protein
MADETEEKPADDAEGLEAWVTVQLLEAPPGCRWAGFVVEAGKKFEPQAARVAFVALQHLTFEEEGAEVVESRIVPVVFHPTGEALYLDGGRGGGPDHGFAGVAETSSEATKIAEAVAGELTRARGAA